MEVSVRSLILLSALAIACPAPPQEPAPTPETPASQPAAAAPANPAGATQASQVTVEGAWVRAVPPGAGTTAFFATLDNGAPTQSRLVAARTDAAANVELHTHLQEDGVMKMRKVEGLDLPGTDHLHLAPGADHIMLIGMSKDLAEGEMVSLELVFADESTVQVKAPVRKEAPESAHGHGGEDAGHGHAHGGHEHEHEHEHADGSTHSHGHNHAEGKEEDHTHEHGDKHGHGHEHGHGDH